MKAHPGFGFVFASDYDGGYNVPTGAGRVCDNLAPKVRPQIDIRKTVITTIPARSDAAAML